MTFKTGDKVRKIKMGHSSGCGAIGSIGIIDNPGHVASPWSCDNMDDWELAESTNKSIMTNLKEKFANIFKKEPQKSFVKAGITDSSDQLTSDGQVIFLSWLLQKNGDQFKTDVVDALLADEK